MFAVWTCAVAALHGRILSNLATTRDGSARYFSSSLGLKNSEVLPHPKIFQWTPEAGFTILAQRSSQGDLGNGLSNYYRLSQPQVTSDGTLVAFTESRDCFRPFKFIGCAIPNPPQTGVLADGQQSAQTAGSY